MKKPLPKQASGFVSSGQPISQPEPIFAALIGDKIAYSVLRPADFAFFQRFLIAAAILARAAALILRRAFLTGLAADFPLTFAHRAFWAAAILALAAALILRRLPGAAEPAVLPSRPASFFCSDSILCLMPAARRS